MVQDFRLYSYAQHLVQYYSSHLSGQHAWEPEARQDVLVDDNEDGQEDDEEQQAQQGYHPQQQPEEQQGEQQTGAERAAEEQQRVEGPPAGLATGRPPPPVSLLRSLGPQFADSRQTGAGTEARLRIVFQKRDGIERQLSNAAELVKLCNRWRYQAPSGAQVTALCWQVCGMDAGGRGGRVVGCGVGCCRANRVLRYLAVPSLQALPCYSSD